MTGVFTLTLTFSHQETFAKLFGTEMREVRGGV